MATLGSSLPVASKADSLTKFGIRDQSDGPWFDHGKCLHHRHPLKIDTGILELEHPSFNSTHEEVVIDVLMHTTAVSPGNLGMQRC